MKLSSRLDLAVKPPNRAVTNSWVHANLGLHQRSLKLGWFTPGYMLPPLRGYLASLHLPGGMNRICVDTNAQGESNS